MTKLVCDVEEAETLGHFASMVLNQIRFWLYKAHEGDNYYVVPRPDGRWLAHSREQLCEEMNYSPRQMRDALAKLKAHGFIRIEQHLFHRKNVSHFQAAEEGKLAGKGQDETVKNAHPYVDAPVHPELDVNDQLINKETILETKGEYGAQNAPTLSGKKKNKNGEKEEVSGANPTAIKPSSPAAVFRAAWMSTYPDLHLPEFDAKAMGQFKNLVERCPSGEAAAVVECNVRRWDVFCSYAIARQGAYKLPGVPDVGSLLRFVQSAVHLYHDHRASLAKPKPKPKKYIPPVPKKIPEPVGEKPATLEEVATILGKQL